MGWIEPVSTAITTIELTNKFIEAFEPIKKHISRFRYWILNGNAVIPIFGAGGVGKSTVSKAITMPETIAPLPYEESRLIETVKLQGDIPGRLLVAPGQLTRVDRHWPELFQEIVTGKRFGIINVVSYGYHAFNLQSYVDHDLYQTGMTVDDFMLAYTEHRRFIEIEMLKKLISGLSAVNFPMWMVTLVNKQDLWWLDRSKVKKHYQDGNYMTQIDHFTQHLGKRSFQHEFLPASLFLSNMSIPGSNTVIETAGGYDMPTHQVYLNSLFDNFDKLISQGAP